MTRNQLLLASSLAFSGFGAFGASCHPLSSDCVYLLTCGGGINLGGAAGDSSGGGGAPNSGGNGTTGGATSGGGGSENGTGGLGGNASGGLGGDGGAPPAECGNATCTEEEPYCDESDEMCVECLQEEHCSASPVGAFCKPSTHACVECIETPDCQDPAASACVDDECTPCSDNLHCEHLADTPVCDVDAGTCVECLNETDCNDFVCAPETHTCTDRLSRSLYACEECEHDMDCQEGQLCVPQSYDDGGGLELIGNFCTWTKDGRPATSTGTCFSDGRPFAYQTVDPVSSVDGVAAVLCVLATTTCPAFLQHRQVVPGCDASGADIACGAENIEDGLCRLNTGGDALCTYPCGGSEDCKQGFTCTVDGYCSL